MKTFLQWAGALCLLLFSLFANSQSVTVTVVVPPPYPVYLEDYLEFRSQSIITLTNITGSPVQLKLLASVSSPTTGVSAKIKQNYQPVAPVQLGPGETKVLTGNQLRSINSNLTPEDIDHQGFEPKETLRTGTLPEGIYQLCIRAYDFNTGTPLSAEMMGCAMLNITHYDPPIILQPQNGSMVNATQPQFLNFVWTPAGLPGKTRYELRLVDMTATGLFNPNDAFTGIVLPFFQKNNLIQNSYAYGIADLPLQNNHQYAVEVVAYDPTNSILFKNGGRSAVTTFTWKKQNILQLPNDIVIINPPPPNPDPNPVIHPNLDIQDAPPPVIFNMMACQQPLNIPNKNAISGQGIIGVNDKLNIGGHELLLTEVNWIGKKLSGKGKINNSWFKIPILVEFSDLEVNSDKVVLDGTAKARDDNNSPLDWLNDMSNISLGEAEIQKAINKLLGQSNDRIVEWPNTKNVGVGMPVGIKRNIGGGEQIIAIVGMHFGPGGSAFNAVAQVNVPTSGQKINLGAAGVCFGPNGLTNDAFLFLGNDYTVYPNGAINMLLKKGVPNDPTKGTYLTMENKGFKNMQLDGSLVLSASKVKPIDKNLTKVEAPFKIFVENFRNFLLDNISLTPFEVVGLPGFEITATGISYDHSEIANPQGIAFPTQNYNTEGNLWQGFYFKTLKIKLPKKLNDNTEISAEKMVFDKHGFSGILSVPLVFGTNKGSMGEKKWPFSLENLYVRVIKNTLEEGRFKGKIRVPITKDDFFFDYKATISYVNDLKYQFNLQPTQDVDFPAVIAKGKIWNETHIQVEDKGNGFEPAFHFYGSIELNTTLGANVQGYDLSFSGMEVKNLVVDKTGVKLGEGGTVKYNSPQKTLAGFDVSIKDFTIGMNSLGFAIGIDFTDAENSVVGGTTGINVLCKWQGNMLRFDQFKLDSITVKGDMSIVNVDGKIYFYENDPVYDKGFRGKLKATIQLGEGGAGLGASLELLIGRKKAENYKYFYFDGSVELPEPVSIPLTSSMRLFGFRGGIYHHVKREGNNYVPDKSTIFGIKGGVAIGLDSRTAFHAKLTLEAAFDKNGIASMFFDGDAYIFTNYQTGFEKYPGTQPVYLGVNMSFDFKKKIFNLLAQAQVAYPTQSPLIKGGGQMQVYVAGLTDWFVKVGTPDNRVSINLMNLFQTGKYFMAGYGLGPMPDLPPLVKEVCKIQNMPNSRNEAHLTDAGTGLAFALGSEFGGGSGTGDLEWWIFFARFNFVAGFDVMLYQQQVCTGLNGWYALGQGYFAFDGAVGLKFQFTKKSPVRKITLLEAQLGAYAKLGIANPFWIEATLHGKANLLGIIEGEFHYEVHYGEKCMGTPDFKEKKPLDGIAFIKDNNPKEGDKNVSVFAQPQVKLAFNTNPGKVYTLKEQDNQGNVTERQFRFPLKRMYLREDKQGGKTLADTASPGLSGKFDKNFSGDLYSFSSDVALPGYQKMLWVIEIEILEKVNGQWVPSSEGGVVKEEIRFTTGASPKTIEDANVLHCYPDRFQRYYLQNDNARKGFVQVKIDAYQDLFDLKPAHVGAVPDKIKVKFIPIGGGSTLEGQYLGYSGKRVHFSHPPLQNNRMYIVQFVKVLSPSGFLQANVNQNNPDLNILNVGGDLVKQLTEKQKVLGALKMEAREYEIYKFIFRTSQYNALAAKLAGAQPGTVDNGNNAPQGHRNVTVKMQEGFDKADFKFLTFDWSLGFGFGGSGSGGGDSQGNTQGGQGVSNYKANAYWDNYLRPYIYHGHNNVLKPLAYPNVATIAPVTVMSLANPEPLLTQAEINQALNQNANQQPGIILQGNLPLKEMKFYLFGEMYAYSDYKNLLMPRLFNLQNPVIKQCMNNSPACNPNLRQLMDYHLANKQFKTLTAGNYQTLVGYNTYFVTGLDGDNRKPFDWKRAMGIQLNMGN